MIKQILFLIVLFASSIIAFFILVIIEPYDLIYSYLSRFIKNKDKKTIISIFIDSFINTILTYLISHFIIFIISVDLSKTFLFNISF